MINFELTKNLYELDFAIFGALADVIGAELFPADTASKELLKGLGESFPFNIKIHQQY